MGDHNATIYVGDHYDRHCNCIGWSYLSPIPQFPPPDTQQQLSFHCSEQTRERHGSSRLVNRRLNGCYNVLFVKWCSIVKKYDLLNCIIKFVNLPGYWSQPHAGYLFGTPTMIIIIIIFLRTPTKEHFDLLQISLSGHRPGSIHHYHHHQKENHHHHHIKLLLFKIYRADVCRVPHNNVSIAALQIESD